MVFGLSTGSDSDGPVRAYDATEPISRVMIRYSCFGLTVTGVDLVMVLMHITSWKDLKVRRWRV